MCPTRDTFSAGQARSGVRYTLPMATLARSRRPATERDLDDLPEEVIGQIVDGELIVHPRPDAPHTEAAGVLYGLLFNSYWRERSDPGGWVILPEPKILFGEQILIPDLAGWRVDRYARPPKGAYTVAPDWVCEILSPSTARFDRVTKLPIYSQAEIRHAWLLDPDIRMLEVLRLEGGNWTIVAAHQNAERVRAEPFEALALDLSLLWGEETGGPAPVEAVEDAQPQGGRVE